MLKACFAIRRRWFLGRAKEFVLRNQHAMLVAVGMFGAPLATAPEVLCVPLFPTASGYSFASGAVLSIAYFLLCAMWCEAIRDAILASKQSRFMRSLPIAAGALNALDWSMTAMALGPLWLPYVVALFKMPAPAYAALAVSAMLNVAFCDAMLRRSPFAAAVTLCALLALTETSGAWWADAMGAAVIATVYALGTARRGTMARGALSSRCRTSRGVISRGVLSASVRLVVESTIRTGAWQVVLRLCASVSCAAGAVLLQGVDVDAGRHWMYLVAGLAFPVGLVAGLARPFWESLEHAKPFVGSLPLQRAALVAAALIMVVPAYMLIVAPVAFVILSTTPGDPAVLAYLPFCVMAVGALSLSRVLMHEYSSLVAAATSMILFSLGVFLQ